MNDEISKQPCLTPVAFSGKPLVVSQEDQPGQCGIYSKTNHSQFLGCNYCQIELIPSEECYNSLTCVVHLHRELPNEPTTTHQPTIPDLITEYPRKPGLGHTFGRVYHFVTLQHVLFSHLIWRLDRLGSWTGHCICPFAMSATKQNNHHPPINHSGSDYRIPQEAWAWTCLRQGIPLCHPTACLIQLPDT